jgi:eukaryotic-like serine/threonine-protein kinase
MTEEQVFLAALDLPEPVDRVCYLEKVCGGDVEFRRQVDELLAAHFKTGAFLDEPVGQPMRAGQGVPIVDNDKTRRASPGANAGIDETNHYDEPDDLHFLQPTSRPDSLGRLGHYEVLQILGKGGFGIVFRAFDDTLQRVVAVKVLAPAMAATSPARKRFLREARSSAQVRHENVVQVYAVEEQPVPYLVMEYIPGETLHQRLDRTGPLEAPEIVRLGRQIAAGLAAAHATDLVHRDIKPDNVLLEGAQQQVKITDFGLARAADDASLSQSGVLAGTPMFMAPEQAMGGSLDHRADLFSLGSVLYVMASGRPPFRASTTYAVLKRVVEDEPRSIRELIPEMPQWLCDIIAKLQAKKPADRFQSAREVADLFADCEAQLREHAKLTDFSRIPRMKSVARRFGRWKWLAAGLVLAIIGPALMKATSTPRWLWYRQDTPDSLIRANENRVRSEQSAARGRAADFTNTLGMRFNLIPAGTFTMGSSRDEIDHFVGTTRDEVLQGMIRSEGPKHQVEITEPFYLGITEVTVGQFERFVEANPDYSVGDERWKSPGFDQSPNHPVVWVSWRNAVDFCNWLSEKEGRKYRLPSEAEWEYCCRAGKSGTRYCYGDDEDQLENYAWYHGNSGPGTHPVGEKKPNAWGLYDMHGNVFEFCGDWHDSNYYKDRLFRDPKGPKLAVSRVTRGGAWSYPEVYSRSSFRSWLGPRDYRDCIGFRVLLVSPPGGLHPDSGK